MLGVRSSNASSSTHATTTMLKESAASRGQHWGSRCVFGARIRGEPERLGGPLCTGQTACPEAVTRCYRSPECLRSGPQTINGAAVALDNERLPEHIATRALPRVGVASGSTSRPPPRLSLCTSECATFRPRDVPSRDRTATCDRCPAVYRRSATGTPARAGGAHSESFAATTASRLRTVPITRRTSSMIRSTAARLGPSRLGSMPKSCASARSAARGLLS